MTQERNTPSIPDTFTVRYDRDADVYVSHAPAADVYSQGRTHDEAVAALVSALTLLVGVWKDRALHAEAYIQDATTSGGAVAAALAKAEEALEFIGRPPAIITNAADRLRDVQFVANEAIVVIREVSP